LPSPVAAGRAVAAVAVALVGSNEIGLFVPCGLKRTWTLYPSGYSFESTTTSTTSRSVACHTSPRTVKAELVTRNERSVNGYRDRAPVTRRHILGVSVTVDDDDTERLCGRTVSVGDAAVVTSDDSTGTGGEGEGGGATPPPPLLSPALKI
jgi:hypothetical protein